MSKFSEHFVKIHIICKFFEDCKLNLFLDLSLLKRIKGNVKEPYSRHEDDGNGYWSTIFVLKRY